MSRKTADKHPAWDFVILVALFKHPMRNMEKITRFFQFVKNLFKRFVLRERGGKHFAIVSKMLKYGKIMHM